MLQEMVRKDNLHIQWARGCCYHLTFGSLASPGVLVTNVSWFENMPL